MQLEGLSIALRARTPWEAVDLGMALVRAHAARIWAAWVLVTLPAFVLLNILGYLIGAPWVAAIALWWLKPAFDRIPLHIISRAVFGAAPSLRETLVAQKTSGLGPIVPWLLWRRFHPGRAMLFPVDLLEGAKGAQRKERVRVLSRTNVSPNVMLTVLGINLEIMLGISIVLLGLMFVPVEFLSDSAKAVWRVLIEEPPLWAQILANFVGWITLTIVEPFYVGAGFGLYLNRRMQLEGWDIELAFRHLAARLSQPLMAAAVLLVAAAVFSMPTRAEEATTSAVPTQPADDSSNSKTDPESVDDAAEHDKKDAKDKHLKTTLEKMFADSYRDDSAEFAAAVKKTYSEGDLKSTARDFVWKRRHPLDEDTKKSDAPWWARSIGQILGFIAEYGLWILLAVGLLFVVANRHRWLPWISDRYASPRLPDRIDVHDVVAAEPLPVDLPAAVRALLQRGQRRAALALLYRAGVERLATSLGTPLPAGATESECLRRSRRLTDTEYAALFARIVRNWQAAAYAQRLPTEVEVEALLAAWSAPVQAPP
jgi:hypothetical protein